MHLYFSFCIINFILNCLKMKQSKEHKTGVYKTWAVRRKIKEMKKCRKIEEWERNKSRWSERKKRKRQNYKWIKMWQECDKKRRRKNRLKRSYQNLVKKRKQGRRKNRLKKSYWNLVRRKKERKKVKQTLLKKEQRGK